MTMNIERLVLVHNGDLPVSMYHGDIQRDTVDALTVTNDMKKSYKDVVDTMDEVRCNLPIENELADIISVVDQLKKMVEGKAKRDDLLDTLEYLAELATAKDVELFNAGDHCRDLIRRTELVKM